MTSPQRTCVGCRRVADQSELTRFVLVGGVVHPDPAGTAPGRGAWLHPRQECFEAAARRGGFARSFRRPADPAGLQELHWQPGASGR